MLPKPDFPHPAADRGLVNSENLRSIRWEIRFKLHPALPFAVKMYIGSAVPPNLYGNLNILFNEDGYGTCSERSTTFGRG